MFIPETVTNLPAGEYPAAVRAACEVCEVKPDELMGWTVRPEEVSIVLPAGQKVKFVVVGKWVNPPFPWMVDNSPPAAEHMPQVGAFELPESGQWPVASGQKEAGKKKRR